MSVASRITVRFAAACHVCGRRVEPGEEASWRHSPKRGPGRVTCLECLAPPNRTTKLPFTASIVTESGSYEILVTEEWLAA